MSSFSGRASSLSAPYKFHILPVATTLTAYGAATALGGSGFIAAFIAVATFGLMAKEHVNKAMHFTEETGVALDSVTFLVFGAVLLGPVLKQVSWQIVVYAVLSLTIVRMLPVALALLGTHARPATVAFIGWFGPLGLASIVFAVIVEDARIPHAAAVATITYLTVALSVFAHGLSAAPLADRYVGWFKTASSQARPLMESAHVHEHRSPLRANPGRVRPAGEA